MIFYNANTQPQYFTVTTAARVKQEAAEEMDNITVKMDVDEGETKATGETFDNEVVVEVE